MTLYADSQNFVEWLRRRVLEDARGDSVGRLEIAPSGRLWLGRLAPQARVEGSLLGERGERMEPCEMGIKVRPKDLAAPIQCRISAVAWVEDLEDGQDSHSWRKLDPIDVDVGIKAPVRVGEISVAGADQVAEALASSGAPGLSMEIRAELEDSDDGEVLVLTAVNTSPEKLDHVETNLYQVALDIAVGPTSPFLLAALPDSFRYSREIAAYGVNCGVERHGDRFITTDMVTGLRRRPSYWDDAAGVEPDLTFKALSTDPVVPVTQLVDALERWGTQFWSPAALSARAEAEKWPSEATGQAASDAVLFWQELGRVRGGAALLERDERLHRAFMLMNLAFDRAALKYDRWRPFQLGFLLSCLPSIATETSAAEAAIVDTLWFATGGGKTETYLSLLVTAAFFDRLRGKAVGITAWTRFPLRMLSLQQLQRFADIFAAAELVRRDQEVRGATFSLGFLVGPATPNRLRMEPGKGEADFRDADMPARYQVLLKCPFCRQPDIRMEFDRAAWRLQHRCLNDRCDWNTRKLGALPFYVVDEEIYRFLPTAVVGTLDKAANLSMQAAMRGFYSAPLGRCPAGHGYTYSPRSKTPNGCLFPECTETPDPVPQVARLFAPTLRLQDELHLLRDSLGAIDSHYEALFDAALKANGVNGKVLASSATLQGHERQVDVLYRRSGRLFPHPGPYADRSFWSVDSHEIMRSFIALAPRGVTTEFASDRINEALQVAVRRAIAEPSIVAAEAGVPEHALPDLVCLYGVGVVYGPTLRDVEAAARSFETQIPLEPLISVRLTGSTPFDEVREILGRLGSDCNRPFGERIHLIAASSMLSHGVDVDRLNLMVVLGMPLTMAEFIQTTSRVGRAHPGLVFVLMKIARERDAGVYRSFEAIIRHSERLIDPVPITRKSRRVLDVTFAGLFMGRLYSVHEPRALAAGLQPLTTVRRVKSAFQKLKVTEDDEASALITMLEFSSDLDENLRADMRQLMRQTFRALNDPATSVRFLSDLLPNGGPMLSLRDVEQQVPVYTRRLQ